MEEQKSNKKGCGSGCFISLLIFISAIGLCFLIGIIALIATILSDNGSTFSGPLSSFSSSNDGLIEKFVEGNSFSKNKIALIEIRGMITEDGNNQFWQSADSSLIIRQLMRAEKDESIKGVLLYLDTPGGEVTAADNIYEQILRLKKTGKIVVSYMNSISASGGYYIAVASDYIIAHRLCITGSIGVIMQSYNYKGLLDKIGVFTETYKSGAMKDMLDGSRIRTEEEKVLVQNIIDKIYNDFVRIVAEGRKIDEKVIKETKIGDGRIFLGSEALELGMIDETGFYDNALNKTLEMAGIPSDDYKLVTYHKTISFSELLANLKSTETKIAVNFKNINSLEAVIEPGKPYFLPAR